MSVNGSDAGNPVEVSWEDDGTVDVVFGPGAAVTAGGLAAAFASLPADAEVDDIGITWSNAVGCDGQGFEDREHFYPVVGISLVPAGCTSWEDKRS